MPGSAAQPLKIAVPRLREGDLCACGRCNQPHNRSVTQTVHSAHGKGWYVLYFRTKECKTRFNLARVAQ